MSETVPQGAEDWFRRGVEQLDAAQLESARQAFERALALDPRHARARNNLGTLLQWDGRHDEAEACYRQALADAPALAPAWFNLGELARERRRPAEALEPMRKALVLEEDRPEWRVAHAAALGAAAKPREALEQLREAARLAPESATIQELLGNALLECGEAAAALQAYRRAVELVPALASAHSRALATLGLLAEEDADAIYHAHLDWARAHEVQAQRRHGNDATPGRRLRIGYLAPDLGDPALACLLEPVLAAHDRAAVEIYCYSDADTESASAWRLRAHADAWHASAHLDAWHMPIRLHEDRIDILVDLGGHAAGGYRMGLLAMHPAPLQLEWPAYPCTTGLEVMDGRLTDWQMSPDGDARLYTEPLLRLPGRQWCFRPQADAPLAAAIPSAARAAVTFGAFHGMARVSPEAVAAWAAALHAVPGSRLILRSHGAPDLAAPLAERFAAEGIEASRLAFEDRLPLAEHLARHDRIDLWLDATPWSNAAGTFYALWMGVPVLSLRGQTPAGRAAAEILAELDLAGWVADDAARFGEIAAALAADTAARTRWRTDLRARLEASTWMDAATYTRGLEATYRELWRAWCADRRRRQLPPAPAKRPEAADDLVVAVDGVCFQDGREGPPQAPRLWRNLLAAWQASGFLKHVVLLDRGGDVPELPGLRRHPLAPTASAGAVEDRALVQAACDAVGAKAFISTGYTRPERTPAVALVTDMIPEMLGFQADLPRWQARRACIEGARRCLALSRHCIHDLRRLHIASAARTSVAYPGVGAAFRLAADEEVAQFRARHGLARPYFLLSGPREPKECNGRALFRALGRLADRGKYAVLCLGGEAEIAAESLREAAGVEVRRLDLDDAELRLAYAGALALVNVPLYEGFPLAVAEAMRCGCPVIASSHAALPEVAGDAALYVQPTDPGGLALALEHVQRPEVRARMIARGMERARPYAWEPMAADVAGLLQQAASEENPPDATQPS